MKTLAFVIFTITSGDMAGVEIYTPDPRPCEATVDGFLKKLASIGVALLIVGWEPKPPPELLLKQNM